MAKRRSTWVLAILAVVAFAATLVIAGAVWFFTSALERSSANQPTAEREFDAVRARFQNSKPLFEMVSLDTDELESYAPYSCSTTQMGTVSESSCGPSSGHSTRNSSHLDGRRRQQ
jgi:hypothetical protein